MTGDGGGDRSRRRIVESAIAGAVALVVTWQTAPLLAPVLAAASRADTAQASVAPAGVPVDALAAAPDEPASSVGIEERGGATRPVRGPRFRFTATDDTGRPVRFDPCRVIRYVIHRGPGAPADAERLAHDAVATVSEATGLRFAFEGLTPETFGARLVALNDPQRQRSAAPPVLISFETPDDTNRLGSDAGRGAPEYWITDRAEIASGAAVVSTAAPARTLGSPHDGLRSALLHELGHVVGLGHAGTGQLMAPVLDPARVLSFQAGDLEGLAEVGRSTPCPAPTESS